MGICDQETFKQVYSLHVESIQRFLLAKGAGHDATDLAQDAFVRLWKNCAKVPFEKAKSFLYTTASNLFIDTIRKAKTKKRYVELSSKVSEVENPHFSLEAKEYKQKLEEAINSIPELSKEVFLMNRFNDLKYREIAVQLNISIKAVEKRMSKALKHLANFNIFKK